MTFRREDTHCCAQPQLKQRETSILDSPGAGEMSIWMSGTVYPPAEDQACGSTPLPPTLSTPARAGGIVSRMEAGYEILENTPGTEGRTT